jgi:hypothetical protein
MSTTDQHRVEHLIKRAAQAYHRRVPWSYYLTLRRCLLEEYGSDTPERCDAIEALRVAWTTGYARQCGGHAPRDG